MGKQFIDVDGGWVSVAESGKAGPLAMMEEADACRIMTSHASLVKALRDLLAAVEEAGSPELRLSAAKIQGDCVLADVEGLPF
jgi:ApbE superfamily uncharacterized protein (UPF0280 family)